MRTIIPQTIKLFSLRRQGAGEDEWEWGRKEDKREEYKVEEKEELEQEEN